MGFELPLGLLGILAAVAVLAAHLVRRRDLPTRELPTVRLLAQAAAESRRRLRLRDLLLLALRMLAIGALAIGLAGPFADTAASGDDGRVGSLVIVLDDSMSMGARKGSTSSWDSARGRAMEALDSLPSGSEAAVILAGHPARIVVHRTDDLDLARRGLAGVLPPASRGTDLPAAVESGARILDGSRHPHRRLLVLSDFDGSSDADEVAWPSSRVAIELFDVGQDGLSNRALLEANATPDPLNPGTVSIRVKARALPDDEELMIRLVHRGDEIARRSIPVAEGLASGTLSAPRVDEGDATATLELTSGDDLPADDRMGVLLRAPASIRVVLVGGPRQGGASRLQPDFLARALDVAPGTAGSIQHRRADLHTLGASLLATTDVVVLANSPAPSSTLWRRLGRFVEAGGGLLVAGGDRVNARAYSSGAGGLLPAHISAASGSEAVFALKGVDPRILPSGGNLEGTRTRRRLLLEPEAGATLLARFDDDTPALVMSERGEGRTALLATTLDDDWTDLPYYPSFVPFALRLVELLAHESSSSQTVYQAGEVASLPVPDGARLVEVIDPRGDARTLPSDEGGRYSATASAGAYRLRADGVEIGAAAFVVRAPAQESALIRRPVPQLDPGDDDAGEGLSATRRTPLAAWFFLLAGLLLIAEGLVRARPLLRSAGRG